MALELGSALGHSWIVPSISHAVYTGLDSRRCLLGKVIRKEVLHKMGKLQEAFCDLSAMIAIHAGLIADIDEIRWQELFQGGLTAYHHQWLLH